MLKGRKILVVAPHPDDEAICSGGLIMSAKKSKANVFVLYMSIGNSRQLVTGQTNPNQRIEEIKETAKYGNFDYKILFNGEEFMRMDTVPQKVLIEEIENTSETFKPDIVVIPFRHSFDQDHRAVASASITAFRPLPSTLRHQPTMILESEEPYTWSDQNIFQPNVFFDISHVFDEKIELLKCHKTQLRIDPFPRSSSNLKRLAEMMGCEISVTYAESYHLLKQVIK